MTAIMRRIFCSYNYYRMAKVSSSSTQVRPHSVHVRYLTTYARGLRWWDHRH